MSAILIPLSIINNSGSVFIEFFPGYGSYLPIYFHVFDWMQTLRFFLGGLLNFVILLKGMLQGGNPIECSDLMTGDDGMSPIIQCKLVA